MKSPWVGISVVAVAWLALVGWVSYEKSHQEAHAVSHSKTTVMPANGEQHDHQAIDHKAPHHEHEDCECCREGHDHEHHDHASEDLPVNRDDADHAGHDH